MNFISVKELRQKLPFVRNKLKAGETFLIIFQSKPIAKLTPFDLEEATDEDIEMAAIADFNEEDEDISDEELNYYLSLKPQK